MGQSKSSKKNFYIKKLSEFPKTYIDQFLKCSGNSEKIFLSFQIDLGS